MKLKLRKFEGNIEPLEDFMSASAFVYILENQGLDSNEVFQMFQDNLQGLAFDWFHAQGFQDESWTFVKSQFLHRFLIELTVVQKVTIRQSLKQCFLADEESVQEFLQRCILAQFAIDDETQESAHFQRHVLLNFLLGLRPEIQSKVIADDLRTLQAFSNAAEAYEMELNAFEDIFDVPNSQETAEEKKINDDMLSCKGKR